jgi:aerobic carbon-monoxide dehydrogenase medium subunit
MIPQNFEYSAPRTLPDALKLLADPDCKILAGGMSLIPMMKLRLAAPAHLVDLGRVPELNAISEKNGVVHVGAMATHHAVENGAAVRGHAPLLAAVAASIGDVQVRNRGTIGGSIAHADPAADYPAALLALEARIRVASATSDRVIAAADFFLDAFTTALEPGEIVLEIQVPAEDSSEGWAYEKVAHPASGFAVVGVAARVRKQGGRVTMARIGITGLAACAFRDRNAEQQLEAGGEAVFAKDAQANSDLFASAEYRLHLARVHGARAWKAAQAKIA